MNYENIGLAIANIVRLINYSIGRSEVEWAYKDFRADLIDAIDDACNKFDDGEFDFKDILTDEAATEIGKNIAKALYEATYEYYTYDN